MAAFPVMAPARVIVAPACLIAAPELAVAPARLKINVGEGLVPSRQAPRCLRCHSVLAPRLIDCLDPAEPCAPKAPIDSRSCDALQRWGAPANRTLLRDRRTQTPLLDQNKHIRSVPRPSARPSCKMPCGRILFDELRYWCCLDGARVSVEGIIIFLGIWLGNENRFGALFTHQLRGSDQRSDIFRWSYPGSRSLCRRVRSTLVFPA